MRTIAAIIFLLLCTQIKAQIGFEEYYSEKDLLTNLQKAKSANDIICTQARFTNEINKKLTLSAQRFLNASLGHIADYNEWLKEHCDLATD